MNYTPLTDEEKLELKQLNQSVTDAIAKRRDWLDRKMLEHSDIKVGDFIYDARTGQPLGTVSELYRYWRDQDEGIRDTSLAIEYTYEMFSINKDPSNKIRSFNNTSCQPLLTIMKKD